MYPRFEVSTCTPILDTQPCIAHISERSEDVVHPSVFLVHLPLTPCFLQACTHASVRAALWRRRRRRGPGRRVRTRGAGGTRSSAPASRRSAREDPRTHVEFHNVFDAFSTFSVLVASAFTAEVFAEDGRTGPERGWRAATVQYTSPRVVRNPITHEQHAYTRAAGGHAGFGDSEPIGAVLQSCRMCNSMNNG